MKTVAGYTAAIVATLALLYGVWQFRVIVILILLSVFLAASVRPLIAQLAKYKIPAGAAQLAVYGLGIFFVVLPLVLYGQELSAELINLSRDLRVFFGSVYASWGSGSGFQQMIVEQVPYPAASLRTLLQPRYITTILGLTQNIFALGGGAALVLVMSVYWSADQNHFERLWLSFLSPGLRKNARHIWRGVEEAIGDYIFSQFIYLVTAFLLLGGAFYLLQVRYTVLLTLITAGLLLIPLIGGGLAVLTTVFIGLLSSPATALTAAIAAGMVIVVIRYTVKNLLLPSDRPSALLSLFFAAVLVTLLGIVGLFLAPLFAKATTVALNLSIELRSRRPENETENIDHFRQRLVDLQRSLEQQDIDEELPTEIKSMLSRLNQLINKTEQFLNLDQGIKTSESS